MKRLRWSLAIAFLFTCVFSLVGWAEQSEQSGKNSLPSVIYNPEKFVELPPEDSYIFTLELPIRCCCDSNNTQVVRRWVLRDPSGSKVWLQGEENVGMDDVPGEEKVYVTDYTSLEQVRRSPWIATEKNPFCHIGREKKASGEKYNKCPESPVNTVYTPEALWSQAHENYYATGYSSGFARFDLCNDTCELDWVLKEDRLSRCVCRTGYDFSADELNRLPQQALLNFYGEEPAEVTNPYVHDNNPLLISTEVELDDLLMNGAHGVLCSLQSRTSVLRDACGDVLFEEKWDCSAVVGHDANGTEVKWYATVNISRDACGFVCSAVPGETCPCRDRDPSCNDVSARWIMDSCELVSGSGSSRTYRCQVEKSDGTYTFTATVSLDRCGFPCSLSCSEEQPENNCDWNAVEVHWFLNGTEVATYTLDALGVHVSSTDELRDYIVNSLGFTEVGENTYNGTFNLLDNNDIKVPTEIRLVGNLDCPQLEVRQEKPKVSRTEHVIVYARVHARWWNCVGSSGGGYDCSEGELPYSNVPAKFEWDGRNGHEISLSMDSLWYEGQEFVFVENEGMLSDALDTLVRAFSDWLTSGEVPSETTVSILHCAPQPLEEVEPDEVTGVTVDLTLANESYPRWWFTGGEEGDPKVCAPLNEWYGSAGRSLASLICGPSFLVTWQGSPEGVIQHYTSLPNGSINSEEVFSPELLGLYRQSGSSAHIDVSGNRVVWHLNSCSIPADWFIKGEDGEGSYFIKVPKTCHTHYGVYKLEIEQVFCIYVEDSEGNKQFYGTDSIPSCAELKNETGQ